MPLAGGFYCYVLFPIDASGALGNSDVECILPGTAAGTLQPQNFALQLNQSPIATLSWGLPPGGVDGQALIAIPWDGSEPVTVPLDPAATSATYNTRGAPACFVLVQSEGADGGNTDVLCGLPGSSTLASTSLGWAAGAMSEIPGLGTVRERVPLGALEGVAGNRAR